MQRNPRMQRSQFEMLAVGISFLVRLMAKYDQRSNVCSDQMNKYLDNGLGADTVGSKE